MMGIHLICSHELKTDEQDFNFVAFALFEND